MRNFLKILIFNLFGNLLVYKILNFFYKNNNKIYVIYYHNTYKKFEQNFEKQILFFKKNFNIISFNEFKNFEFLNKKKPSLLISFDDGHASNYYVASRVLDKFNIKGIFFIPTNYVNRNTEENIHQECKFSEEKFSIICNLTDEISDQRDRVSMNWNEVKDLDSRGHTIGAHTINHVRLSDKLEKDKLTNEIVQSGKFLEEKIKKKIETFCWVGGETWSYGKKADSIIKSNYSYCFTTGCKPFSKNDSNYQIHRFNIEADFSLRRIRTIISGFYELIFYKKRKHIEKITN